MGGDPDDAEDALSRVALRALEDHEASAAAVANYGGWLTRLARNLCMDVHRERAFRQRTLERFAVESPLRVAVVEGHPEAAHLRRELGQRIQVAIGELPPRLRVPCQLRFVEEMAYEVIAEDLGLTNETVRKRIQEARDILCKRLGAYPIEGLLSARDRTSAARPPRTSRACPP